MNFSNVHEMIILLFLFITTLWSCRCLLGGRCLIGAYFNSHRLYVKYISAVACNCRLVLFNCVSAWNHFNFFSSAFSDQLIFSVYWLWHCARRVDFQSTWKSICASWLIRRWKLDKRLTLGVLDIGKKICQNECSVSYTNRCAFGDIFFFLNWSFFS